MKKLTRTPDDRWLTGVCGGISAYTGIDANLVRLVLAICTLLGAGSLVIGYVVAWILMPRRAEHETVWAQAADPSATPHGPAQPSR